MRVKDLIEALSALPQDAKIIVDGYETGFDAVHELEQLQIVQVKNPMDFDGQYQLESELSDRSWHQTPEQRQDIRYTIDHGQRLEAVLIRGKRGHLR